MVDWFLTALAAWRLAHLLVYEDGPWALCARLRYRAGLRAVVRVQDGQPQIMRVAGTTVAEGLSCFWCVAMWSALVLWASTGFLRPLRGILAASAGAIMLEEGLNRLRR